MEHHRRSRRQELQLFLHWVMPLQAQLALLYPT